MFFISAFGKHVFATLRNGRLCTTSPRELGLTIKILSIFVVDSLFINTPLTSKKTAGKPLLIKGRDI